MNPQVLKAAEGLEKSYGAEGALEAIRMGAAAYDDRRDQVIESLTSPDGELARRVETIAREVDPDMGIRFIKGPGAFDLSVHIQGAASKLTPEVAQRLQDEFDKILGTVPGLRALLPEFRLGASFEPARKDE